MERNRSDTSLADLFHSGGRPWPDRLTVGGTGDLCLHELFDLQAVRTPDAIALTHGGEHMTYRVLRSRANQLAERLIKWGVRPGTLVGVYLDRTISMVVGLLAIMKAGGAYVPLDTAYPAERLTRILKETEPPLLLTETALTKRCPPCSAAVICLDREWEQLTEEPGASDSVNRASPSDLAYVMFTSGSTGTPKGVMGHHRGVVNRLMWMWRTFPYGKGEVCCQKTAISFVDSVAEIFGPLLQGVRSVLVPTDIVTDPRRLSDTLRQHAVTRIVLVPSLLRALLELEGKLADRLPELRHWVSSGEVLPRELVDQFRAEHPEAVLLNLYGSSEVAADVTWFDTRNAAPSGPVPIGYPIDNMRCHVLDSGLRPVPAGVTGELYVGGVGVAHGYYRQPELTAERFVDSPFCPGERLYKTGDLVRSQPDGLLQYIGRNDLQVKVRGVRIEIEPIEECLRALAPVRDAAIAVHRGSDGTDQLVAYVVPAQDLAPGEADVTPSWTQFRSVIRAELQEVLPDSMVPTVYVLVDRLPLTPNGKVDRRALPAPGPDDKCQGEYTAPRTPLEATLAAIWAEVLGVERCSVEAGFLELGGHSLSAGRISARISEALGIELRPDNVFEARSISRLASLVEHMLSMTGKGVGPERSPLEASRGIHLKRALLARVLGHKTGTGNSVFLSLPQRSCWYVEQLVPGTALYNIPWACTLSGELDVTTFRAAIHEVMRRHEILQSRLDMVEGQPIQVVLSSMEPDFQLIDLRGVQGQEQDRLIARLLETEARQPFDLCSGPLLRTRLLRVSDHRYVWLGNVHHIVFDGWSLALLLKEVAVMYGDIQAGRPVSLPGIPVQYADFVIWQMERLRSGALEEQWAYWRKQLADAPPVLTLPSDRPRPSVREYAGNSISVQLPYELCFHLKALGQRHQATLHMVLLAAWKILLFLWTCKEDLVVGTPFAGRTRRKFESLIGYFVNTLAMRTQVQGQLTFVEVLSRVRQTALDAFARPELPLDKLVEDLRPERIPGCHPIFQVWFDTEESLNLPLSMPGVTFGPVEEIPTGTAKFDLMAMIRRNAQGYKLVLEYRTDLFNESTIQQLAQQYLKLLNNVAADPGRKVEKLGV